MSQVMALFGVLVLAATALASIAIWAPRSLRLKVAALGVTLAMVASAYGGLVELLGRPKPVQLEWIQPLATGARVLAWHAVEQDAIFLWLQLDGQREPRAYVQPWSLAAAKALYQAMAEAEAQGTQVRMRPALDSQLEPAEPQFFAEPQPALPPKVSRPRSAG
jgi:hypothetical protein